MATQPQTYMTSKQNGHTNFTLGMVTALDTFTYQDPEDQPQAPGVAYPFENSLLTQNKHQGTV